MARDVILLGDVAEPGAEMIEIRCGRCDRAGRLSVARLLGTSCMPWWATARGARLGSYRTGAIPTAPIWCGCSGLQRLPDRRGAASPLRCWDAADARGR
jgi:hypothetical protein